MKQTRHHADHKHVIPSSHAARKRHDACVIDESVKVQVTAFPSKIMTHHDTFPSYRRYRVPVRTRTQEPSTGDASQHVIAIQGGLR